MPFDAFLKLSTVPGECTDDKHKEWIEVLSFNWGASQTGSGSASTGGALTAQRVDIHEFSIVKVLDKASPKLFVCCCKGDHIPEVKVELCRATGDKSKYMEYKMTDVIVRHWRPGAAAQGVESLPLEEVSFSFAKIDLVYTATDHKTGKPSGDVKAHWDLTTNKGE
jgi:type VI secretion system secreted protein Hcp